MKLASFTSSITADRSGGWNQGTDDLTAALRQAGEGRLYLAFTPFARIVGLKDLRRSGNGGFRGFAL
jgi:hypothetical protein